tara:strand:- start:3647 stop:3829 length:183 start_codon:yes stop_codon:yes gene_type:complete
MTTDEINANLCTYDPRNPLYGDLDEDSLEELRGGDNDCYCDNCFYGRDRLAMAWIELFFN